MKILVVGSGGREHALVWALGKNPSRPVKLFCAPGNAGIAETAQCVPVASTDVASLRAFAGENKIDLTMVGGEAPLAAGLVDAFLEHGLTIVGPTAEAARLESSKAYAKDFMARYGIPTARYRVAGSAEQARKILRSGEFGDEHAPVVVKADGLAAGKGVVVAGSGAEAVGAVEDLMERGSLGADAARIVVIEEALEGPEVSLLLFTDGSNYALMPAARDHKRLGEGDTGPNTGGMGTITGEEVLAEDLLGQISRRVVEPTLAGIAREGFTFRGVLFIGLMLTPDGPRVLEYNVRFGDPEAQAILVRLESDLVETLASLPRGSLDRRQVRWSRDASACVVLASPGYPSRPETGARIEGLAEAARLPAVRIFHSATKRSAGGDWLTAGGRVLGVTATAGHLDAALDRCYQAAAALRWDGMHFRRDIGR